MFRWTLPLVSSALVSAPLLAAAPVDYLRDVKPILTQHCVRCHGATKEEASLRADTAEALRSGGDNGPALRTRPGEESLLLRVVTGADEHIPRMPYKRPPLETEQIEILRAWLAQGAKAPEDEEPGKFEHWAFLAPAQPAPPAVAASKWPRNDLDRFILARLEQQKIPPAPEADRVSLLRRVSLDLTGLPPTPAEVDAFLNDRSPDAYERVVERLLASPHFGERWARPWLDVARYADSNGYSIDAARQIWKYRDWVVNALNRDQPFDQFVIEQLAGDLLPNATVEQKIATGFNRNTQINQEGGIDPEQFRIEAVMDRVNTFGTAFLGLTVGCAQCHDHKFDPITQREYYQLFAFFNNTVQDGHGGGKAGGRLLIGDAQESADDLLNQIETLQQRITASLDAHQAEVETWRRALTPESRAKLRSAALRSASEVTPDNQTLAQRRLLYATVRPSDAEFKKLDDELIRLERREARFPSTLVMQELPKPRESHLFIQGDFTRPGEKVKPGALAILPPITGENLNRLDLARWLFAPKQPLTARVFVNRVWQQYFGRGLVETENDFGTQGSAPTHPELLDWLATELPARGWSQKALHRLIVTSATYRQASRVRADLEVADPLNKLLARQSRLRLDAEVVRDVALAASGLLAPKLGGPPVYPPQPEGVMSLGQQKKTWTPSTGEDRHRRGLYTHYWRATPHPALAVFDAPDSFSACTRRIRSNTPLQSLTLLNDTQFFEFAQALAARVQREAAGADLPAQLAHAFRVCVARAPSAQESARLVALFEQESKTGTAADAWTLVARVLLNLDETITRE